MEGNLNESDSDIAIFNQSVESMESEDKKILFEQYKLFVGMADEISKRRLQANSFFLTANTLLIALLTAFLGLTSQTTVQHGWITIAAIAGIAFSWAWLRLISSYRQLNDGKFKVVHLLESRMPARLFDVEWEILKEGDGTVYTPFHKTERIIPWVFTIIYILLGLYGLWRLYESLT